MTYQKNSHLGDDVFKEGMIDDALKSTADVDPAEIKSEWQKSTSTYDKLDSLNKEGLSKAKDSLGSIDRTLKKNRVDTRSIVARAKNSVLQFPIYVTQTLRVNEAQIIAKLFERVYTTLVQTVLSHNQILDEEEANNLVFLKNFHTNLKEAADVLVNTYYKPIDELDQMMQESIFYSQQLTENCRVDFSVIPCTNQDLIQENARLLNDPLTGFIYLKEAKEVVTKGSSEIKGLSDSELEDIAANRADITAEEKRLAKGDKPKDDASDEDKKKYTDARKKLDDAVADLKGDIKKIDMPEDEYKQLSAEERKEIDKLRKDLKGYSFKGGRYTRNDQRGEKSTKHDSKPIDAPKMLRDSDIKKINGMLPYTIEATFRLKTRDGFDRDIKYIIGIKSVMHLIRTQDLADDLQELVTGNIKSLQKVRYKTGEIKFADYFFNIKNIKADAAKHINYNKRWINTLKRLGDYSKMNGTLLKKPVEAMTGGSVPIPNGTLILAQPDVTMLTNQTGIDLSKVSNAKRLAKSLFLIGVVIVDSSAGTMRVLFPDSDTDWDVQSLAAIDSELAKTDNSQLMRELNRMVNR